MTEATLSALCLTDKTNTEFESRSLPSLVEFLATLRTLPVEPNVPDRVVKKCLAFRIAIAVCSPDGLAFVETFAVADHATEFDDDQRAEAMSEE